MPHDITLITTIAVGLGLAMVFGYIAARLNLPPLVGYLVAGIMVGPHTRGFVADITLASQLSEIGIMLLMFGVGLHFSLDDLARVRKISVPGAVVQVSVATALGVMLSMSWGWDFGAGLVFGLALSVASTVVLLRALESRGVLETVNGKIAVGWLIVEDLVTVLVLVVLPPLAPILSGGDADTTAGPGLWSTLGITFAKVSAFVLLMIVVGKRVLPKALWLVARTGSRELFTLLVIASAVGVAWGAAELFGVSFALGAFFAGMMMRESELSHRAADESLPLRDAFSVLFFVAVGMLFDPAVIIEHPLAVLGVLAVIMIGKTLAAITLILVLRYPLNTALLVGASLAQIGEFSFILGGLGVELGLMPPDGQSLILAGALISIALNPAVFRSVEPLSRWIRSRPRLARRLERHADPLAVLPTSVPAAELTDVVVVIGYGRVGERIVSILRDRGVRIVVAEQSREVVERLRERGIHAVLGDASEPGTLVQAHVARAKVLLNATPDTIHIGPMVDIARRLNPDIRILLRSSSEDEARILASEHLGEVFLAEAELARAMAESAIESTGGSTPEPHAA